MLPATAVNRNLICDMWYVIWLQNEYFNKYCPISPFKSILYQKSVRIMQTLPHLRVMSFCFSRLHYLQATTQNRSWRNRDTTPNDVSVFLQNFSIFFQGTLKYSDKTHKPHTARYIQGTDHLPRSVLEQLKLVIFLGGINCATQHVSFWPSFLFFTVYSFSWVMEHW